MSITKNLCPQCGTQVQPGQNFCGHCGAPYAEPAAIPPLESTMPAAITPVQNIAPQPAFPQPANPAAEETFRARKAGSQTPLQPDYPSPPRVYATPRVYPDAEIVQGPAPTSQSTYPAAGAPVYPPTGTQNYSGPAPYMPPPLMGSRNQRLVMHPIMYHRHHKRRR
ncbi:zinc ribbon domain-containing protein [Dictyobacter kobayashii]|uniref:zinc ribbon domain-containing protein n=1 Tax=Dictyobacter kobayashii TaxID=2014872 RepID=UPI001386D333